MQCTLAGDHHPVDGPHGARERAYTQNRPTRGQRGYVDGPHSARAQHLRHGRSPGANLNLAHNFLSLIHAEDPAGLVDIQRLPGPQAHVGK